jgi:hypothetical protein
MGTKSWTAISKHGVPVRLTEERWNHIETGHPEFLDQPGAILDAIRDPIRVHAGKQGEFVAVRKWRGDLYAVVVYREMGEDGFVITAYPTTSLSRLDRMHVVWPLL